MSTLLAIIQPAAFGAIAAILILGFITVLLVIKRVLYVCQPSEVLVFSGRRREAGNNRVAGYRVIRVAALQVETALPGGLELIARSFLEMGREYERGQG